jgi:hypothetical protein
MQIRDEKFRDPDPDPESGIKHPGTAALHIIEYGTVNSDKENVRS